jgi:hypothetical protein
MTRVLCSCLLAALLSAAQQPPLYEKFLGVWKAVPQSDTPAAIKVEPEGHGSFKLEDLCTQDLSSCALTCSALRYDGRQYPCAEPRRSVSVKKGSGGTVELDRYIDGKMSSRTTYRVTGDTLTESRQLVGLDASKPSVSIYRRHGVAPSAEDPLMGVWVTDWKRTPPRTLSFERRGSDLVLTNEAGAQQPKNCDGQQHPVSPEARSRTASCRFVDDHTEQMEFENNGKLLGEGLDTISADGKTMTVIRKNAAGKLTSKMVYEKVK